ncbi:MAG: hypothetical protein PHS79_04495 [Patescibacteria group bacterium]|nr:hypothetical protein [Patescibacteria group bacterium]
MNGITPRFALYLTKLEQDVWDALCIKSEKIGDKLHVGIPRDPAICLAEWISEKASVTIELVEETIQRFVEQRLLIQFCDKDDARNRGYTFGYNYELFVVQPIAFHMVAYEDPKVKEVLKTLQNMYVAGREVMIARRLEDWLMEQLGESSDTQTFRRRCFEWSKNLIFSVGGIFQRQGDDEYFLVCWPGYEANRLVEKDDSDDEQPSFRPLPQIDERALRPAEALVPHSPIIVLLGVAQIKGLFQGHVMSHCELRPSNLTDDALSAEADELAELSELISDRSKCISDEIKRRKLAAQREPLVRELAELESRSSEIKLRLAFIDQVLSATV